MSSESERSEGDKPEMAKSKKRPILSRKRLNQNHSCNIYSYAKMQNLKTFAEETKNHGKVKSKDGVGNTEKSMKIPKEKELQ